MIDTEKKKMEKGKETGSKSAGDDDDDAAPQTPKTSPSKRKRATKAGTEDGDTPSKKPRGTRQKAAKKQEPKDGEENDFAVKKELESDVEDDTIKFENGEEV